MLMLPKKRVAILCAKIILTLPWAANFVRLKKQRERSEPMHSLVEDGDPCVVNGANPCRSHVCGDGGANFTCKKSHGKACSAGRECASGNCYGGVCRIYGGEPCSSFSIDPDRPYVDWCEPDMKCTSLDSDSPDRCIKPGEAPPQAAPLCVVQ